MKSWTNMAVALVALAATLVPTRQAAADECQRPRMLIVLDRSDSMVRTWTGDESIWSAVTNGIIQGIGEYDDAIEFGLMLFPDPALLGCAPGAAIVPPAPNAGADIIAALTQPENVATNDSDAFTPIKQTFDEVAAYAPMLDPDVRRYVLFITDGEQWCTDADNGVYDPEVAPRAADLLELGIPTYVLGVSTRVNSCMLARMAFHGGTVRSGCPMSGPGDSCSPWDDDPAEAECYYQANLPDQLAAAFAEIGRQVGDEVCNGEDDDCDGLIDEGFTDTDDDGQADCIDPDDDNDGSPDDEDCAPLDPKITPGIPEACNGLDDNCNGLIDEGFTDTDGDGQADCIEDDTDGDGYLDDDDCAPFDRDVHPGAVEECDTIDNDCDGLTDELCDCMPAAIEPCGQTGGACVQGQRTCDNDGQWGQCVGAVDPQTETCNGVDDDCDGDTDEGFADADEDGQADCVDDDDDNDGTPDDQDCEPNDPTIGVGVDEVCDGVDQDCDGDIDEGCECMPGAARPCGDDEGACEVGQQTCDTEGRWGDCVGATEPVDEECEDLVDNDCDGLTDENCEVVDPDPEPPADAECEPGVREACGSSEGQCQLGNRVCSDDYKWSECIGDVEPATEICDGLDNDCDGVTDEDDMSLCGSIEEICVQGQCVPDPALSDGHVATSSCAQGGAANSSAAGMALFLMLGLGLFVARRRFFA